MKYFLTIILTILITACVVEAVEQVKTLVSVQLTEENERTSCLADCNYQCNLK
jgi:hypothetical protein